MRKEGVQTVTYTAELSNFSKSYSTFAKKIDRIYKIVLLSIFIRLVCVPYSLERNAFSMKMQ